jgi:hypothetical protein
MTSVVPAPLPVKPAGRRVMPFGPLLLASGLWLGVWGCRHAGLVRFPPLRDDVVAFLGIAYAVFAGCYLLARYVRWGEAGSRAAAPRPPSRAPLSLRQAVLLFSLAGAAGALARGADMLLLRGIDYSAGFSAARLANISLVEDAGAGAHPLSAVGKLLMGCASVAMVVAVLRFERLPRVLIVSALASWALLLLLSIVEGGRNTIVVNLVLLASACLVRRRQGKRVLPWRRPLRLLLYAMVVLAVTYTFHVFNERFAALGYTDDTVLDGIETTFSVELAPWLREMPPGPAKNTLLGFVMLVIYIGHGVDQLGAVCDWIAVQPLGWGRYNLDLVVIALERAGLPVAQYDVAALPNPGLYRSALGELILDVGRAGTLVLLGGLGAVVGWVWRKLRRGEFLMAELVAAFALCWIFASPLYSIISGFLGVVISMVAFRLVIPIVRWFRLPR